MKRLLSVILVIVMMVCCLAGCSGEGDDGLSLKEDGVKYESLAQKAVVKTALAYLARGTRIQYDDSRMNVRYAPSANGVLYRWQYGVRLSPEEYTAQYTGFTNCAAFTHDVYLAALGVDIGPYTTAMLGAIVDDRCVYRYLPKGNETDEEQAAMEKEFRSNLEMGDIIVIRYNGAKSGNGHAMLYVGGEVLENAEGYKGAAAEGTDDNAATAEDDYVYDIIHSTGSSYNYDESVERYEEYGSVQITSVDSLFDDQNSRYIFSKLASIAIIRPLNTFEGEVPENTVNRMMNLDNVMAEKLSTHTIGMNVSSGSEITYTFSITNKNEQDVTLEVKDVVPENTTYVSSENCTVDGSALSWTVTVPAGQTAEVSYTVKVNDDAIPGQYVESKNGSVGGVVVNCPGVYVGTVLTAEQQTALEKAAASGLTEGLRGMELANAAYKEVLGGEADLLDGAFETVKDGVFHAEGNFYYIEWEENAYKDAVAPGLYGGRYVIQKNMSGETGELNEFQENLRTHLVQPEHLMTGDILVVVQDAQEENQKMYMVTGEKLLDLGGAEAPVYEDTDEVLEKIMSYKCFAVLRPSLIGDNK